MASATLVGVRRPDTEGVTLSMRNNPKRAAATLALIVVVAVAAGCSGTSGDNTAEPPPYTAPTVTVRDGNPDVWNRIETGTDCDTLQSEWDTAMDNAEARTPGDRLRTLSLDYAAAASQRMRDLGC